MESTIKYGPQQENFNEADAGDASTSIYQNEDTLNQESEHTSLQPGENVAPLQAAAHGDPDEDLDTEDIDDEDLDDDDDFEEEDDAAYEGGGSDGGAAGDGSDA